MIRWLCILLLPAAFMVRADLQTASLRIFRGAWAGMSHAASKSLSGEGWVGRMPYYVPVIFGNLQSQRPCDKDCARGMPDCTAQNLQWSSIVPMALHCEGCVAEAWIALLRICGGQQLSGVSAARAALVV